MNTTSLPNEDRTLGELASKAFLFAGIPGVFLLAVATVMTSQTDITWERLLRSYLTAFIFVLSLSLGGLFFTMLQHLSRAGWSVVIRRLAEGLAGNLRWIWILFIPIAIGLYTTDLYHWTHAEGDTLLEHKAGYLNTTFWMIRAGIYFLVWGVLAHYFVSSSVAQDTSGDPKITLRMQSVAAPAMILYAFTQSFAIIDWVMALEPHWFSTMFGVYFFAASCCGFGATMILLCFTLQRSGRVTESITTEHYQDLGKFLFAFGIVFWAYIAYSQYLLIWYANIPEETTWFMIRQLGGWGGLSLLLLFGHFAGPFFLIMSRYPKRWKSFLAAACVWMLFIHYVDMYWLAMPAYPAKLVESVSTYAELSAVYETGMIPGTDTTWAAEYGLHWHMVDICCLLGLTGIFLGGLAWGLRRAPLVPEGDPRLGESLAFENY